MPDGLQPTAAPVALDATPVRTLEHVTLEQFRDDILPKSQPVLMKGFVSHWPAVQASTHAAEAAAAYLKRFESGHPVETIYGSPEIAGKYFYNEDLSGLNFERHPALISASLDRILTSMNDTRPASTYIQSVPTPANLPGFAEENVIGVLPPVIEPRIWIGNALTVQTHFDLSDNIACVVAGRRRFTLFSPEQTPNLYVGPFELTLAGPPVSMVRLEEPDYETYPRFREAARHAQIAELEPGDALYIPYFWWHHVQSLERFNVLVNYWWNDARRDLATPFDAMLHAILALRDLPDSQREAWEMMFNHYVFQKNGDPVAHLPEPTRGALGAHTPQMRQQLKATLANNLAHQAGLIPRRK
ncbi:MAG: cupin-like domain-containing protein [Hyphomonadaceae bacterium]|nr:cupin-like domain-containing protein [Hyphomonadaceae bacterium]